MLLYLFSFCIFCGTVASLFYMLVAIYYFQFLAIKKADLIIRSEVVRSTYTLKQSNPHLSTSNYYLVCRLLLETSHISEQIAFGYLLWLSLAVFTLYHTQKFCLKFRCKSTIFSIMFCFYLFFSNGTIYCHLNHFIPTEKQITPKTERAMVGVMISIHAAPSLKMLRVASARAVSGSSFMVPMLHSGKL